MTAPDRSRPRLVCASANPDKVAEIRQILGSVVELAPRPSDVPDVVEDADTLTGNARLKAVAICRVTGEPALADDTGLEVEALDGAPGVYSARFAGENPSYEDNRVELLRQLEGETNRRAAFRTVAIVVDPDGTETVAEGVCNGLITTSERGAGGFGYDSVFQPDEGGGATFAEMAIAEKNVISHRGRAFRALLDQLAPR